MKLSQICQEINIEFLGNDIEIDGLHTLSEATSSQISFFNDKKYKNQLSETKAIAVLIEEQYAQLLPKTTIALVTDEPYLKLALASKFFAHKIETKGGHPDMGEGCDIDKRVRFGKDVNLGDNVTVMAGAYIGDSVTIGSNTLIYPNVTLYHHTEIGSNCIIHAGTVIGSDGYGFAHTKMGEHVKIYQNGNAVIEDAVEIGANCVIDRAVFGTTYIRKGSKLDNLIQIGHNCDVGEHSLIAGQSGLSGSTTTGRNLVMGGQSGTAGHLHIGDFVTVAGKSGVTKSLKGGKTYAGFPAIEHISWLKLQAKIHGLIKRKRR
ncbi:UDP-3-O-(3-hydroxymyristoyl)glucosamine N-acyltransferase [Sulfurovum sp. bin170]|uniref:UDP-3-O-(3-hydroxymyristoyl)glucosamine N-acyltransferase n=1 Tax=Sulfurovum sp. bin170 TaxID=2695268 RepID=UPI0013DFC03C|nr:UDP-3-O-(3-hydroxymyristoyl)glucosamine N-acyltransferase [Sulfurovum sp. bin170]NEW61618.1 UDP-3-O-(3-hydroxymyristoyl)glucosamine N-acyltransferase [Sulfurovum sp. bin170]